MVDANVGVGGGPPTVLGVGVGRSGGGIGTVLPPWAAAGCVNSHVISKVGVRAVRPVTMTAIASGASRESCQPEKSPTRFFRIFICLDAQTNRKL